MSKTLGFIYILLVLKSLNVILDVRSETFWESSVLVFSFTFSFSVELMAEE